MHKGTEKFLKNIENISEIRSKDTELKRKDIALEYLSWIKNINSYEYKHDNGEEYIADKIIDTLKGHRMNFLDACIILGYIRRLLKIDDIYRSGIDIDKPIIEKYLSKELINLAKDIAKYIELQEEVHANIPRTLGIIYEKLKAKSENVILW